MITNKPYEGKTRRSISAPPENKQSCPKSTDCRYFDVPSQLSRIPMRLPHAPKGLERYDALDTLYLERPALLAGNLMLGPSHLRFQRRGLWRKHDLDACSQSEGRSCVLRGIGQPNGDSHPFG